MKQLTPQEIAERISTPWTIEQISNDLAGDIRDADDLLIVEETMLLKADGEAIVSAVNATFGQNINPAGIAAVVEDYSGAIRTIENMRDALRELGVNPPSIDALVAKYKASHAAPSLSPAKTDEG